MITHKTFLALFLYLLLLLNYLCIEASVSDNARVEFNTLWSQTINPSKGRDMVFSLKIFNDRVYVVASSIAPGYNLSNTDSAGFIEVFDRKNGEAIGSIKYDPTSGVDVLYDLVVVNNNVVVVALENMTTSKLLVYNKKLELVRDIVISNNTNDVPALIDSDGRYLYVALLTGSFTHPLRIGDKIVVKKIGLDTYSIVKETEIDIGGLLVVPWSLKFNPKNHLLYIVGGVSNRVISSGLLVIVSSSLDRHRTIVFNETYFINNIVFDDSGYAYLPLGSYLYKVDHNGAVIGKYVFNVSTPSQLGLYRERILSITLVNNYIVSIGYGEADISGNVPMVFSVFTKKLDLLSEYNYTWVSGERTLKIFITSTDHNIYLCFSVSKTSSEDAYWSLFSLKLEFITKQTPTNQQSVQQNTSNTSSIRNASIGDNTLYILILLLVITVVVIVVYLKLRRKHS